VVAGLNCTRYFEKTRVLMPKAIKALLTKCMETAPENRPHDFVEIEATLHEIYRSETGNAYPRPAPKATADTGDSLNNRALSMLDIGKPDEAEAAWETALAAEPSQILCAYNQSLYLWRQGRIDDTAALGTVRARENRINFS
jgi:tetratricopeptide (TPR) repeat protein